MAKAVQCRQAFGAAEDFASVQHDAIRCRYKIYHMMVSLITLFRDLSNPVQVPTPSTTGQDLVAELGKLASSKLAEYVAAMEKIKLREGIKIVMSMSADGNKFIQVRSPGGSREGGRSAAWNAPLHFGAQAHCPLYTRHPGKRGFRSFAMLLVRAVAVSGCPTGNGDSLSVCCDCDVALCLVQDNKPWVSMKEDPEHAATVVAAAVGLVRLLLVLLQPYMPGLADKILNQLNLPRSALQLTDQLIAAAAHPDTLMAPGEQPPRSAAAHVHAPMDGAFNNAFTYKM